MQSGTENIFSNATDHRNVQNKCKALEELKKIPESFRGIKLKMKHPRKAFESDLKSLFGSADHVQKL